MSHVKNSAPGAGANAGKGLARFTRNRRAHNEVSPEDDGLNLSGWALNVYRLFVRIQDQVLAFLHEATTLSSAKQEAEEAYQEAKEAVDEARAIHEEEGSGASAEALESAMQDCATARSEVERIRREQKAFTGAIKWWNIWLEARGAEVRKQKEFRHPKTGEMVPGETHPQRKRRTKESLLALMDGMPAEVLEATPLVMPNLDILAIATGTPKDVLVKAVCDQQGNPLFSGEQMPDGMVDFIIEMGEDPETKRELRDFIATLGLNDGQDDQPTASAA